MPLQFANMVGMHVGQLVITKRCASGAGQEAGILVSRRAHGAHHRAPFEGGASYFGLSRTSLTCTYLWDFRGLSCANGAQVV